MSDPSSRSEDRGRGVGSPDPKQIWSHYEAAFKSVINQAERRSQIDQYFYRFTAYLSEQGIEMKTIEAMTPMIQDEMDTIIRRKFAPPLKISQSQSTDSNIARQLAGDPKDIVLVRMDIRTYNRFAKWFNKQNNELISKQKKINDDNYPNGYKGYHKSKMWMELGL
jgi:hypothetical protein